MQGKQLPILNNSCESLVQFCWIDNLALVNVSCLNSQPTGHGTIVLRTLFYVLEICDVLFWEASHFFFFLIGKLVILILIVGVFVFQNFLAKLNIKNQMEYKWLLTFWENYTLSPKTIPHITLCTLWLLLYFTPQFKFSVILDGKLSHMSCMWLLLKWKHSPKT